MNSFESRQASREAVRKERKEKENERLAAINWDKVDWKTQVSISEKNSAPEFGDYFYDALTIFHQDPSLENLERIPLEVLSRSWWTDSKMTLLENVRVVAEYYQKAGTDILTDLKNVVFDDDFIKVYLKIHDLVEVDQDSFAKKYVLAVGEDQVEQFLKALPDISNETKDFVLAKFKWLGYQN